MMRHKRTLIAASIILVVMVMFFGMTTHAQTATDPATPVITFKPEIAIPGLFSGETTITGTSIATYVRAIFILFIWTVGILATVMVVYGGIKWVAAAGNPGRINDARDIVNNAVIGVIIALASVVLLNTINPSLTKFRGIDISTLRKQLGEFYASVDNTIGQCRATAVKESPDLICSDSGCTAAGALNDWINSAAHQSTGYIYSTFDPFIVKAIIAQESMLNGQPYSRDTQVKNDDGSPASSAYGIGQFVAGTLYEQLKLVRNAYSASLPVECPENNKVIDGHLNPTCKRWLDQAASPDGPVIGLKAQVYMVKNYLHQLSDAGCVKGNLGRMAAAYYLGAGGVRKYCEAEDIVDSKTKTTEQVSKRIEEARQYVASVQKFYSQYCAASS